MSQTKFDHLENFVLMWSQKVFTRWSENCAENETLFGLDFHSSAIKDVDHDALWLGLLCDVRHSKAHALQLQVTAIESVEFETDIIVSVLVTSISSLQDHGEYEHN